MLAIAAGGALGLSLSTPTGAAPRARRSRVAVAKAPRLPTVCAKSTPTKDQCLSPGYLGTCPQHADECKPHGEQAFKKFRQSSAYKSAKKTKVLEPHTDAIPQGLTDAKYFHYRAGKVSRPRVPSTNSVLHRTGFDGPALEPSNARFKTAKDTQREPTWEGNGAHADSCEEYAYEMVYDWGRFSDAAAACRGDWKCEMKIAMLPAAPGIADRTLRRKDGVALPDSLQLSTVDKGTRPKNPMFIFANPEKFILAGGPDGKLERDTSNDALIKAMESGHTHYELGCTSGCNDRQFENEWDYQRALFERNETVSMAEFREYERRKQEFARLVEQYVQATAEEKADIFNVPIDVIEHDFIEAWAIDPSGLADRLEKLQSDVKTRGKTMRKRSGPVRRSKQSTRVTGRVAPRRATNVTKRAGTRKTVSHESSGPLTKGPMVPGGSIATLDPCLEWSKSSSNLEILGIGPLSCRIGKFLREEWARKARGEFSCLDLGIDDCDWSPMDFQRRFVHGVPYTDEQQLEELECNEWTPNTGGDTIANIDESIASLKADASKGWKELTPFVTRSSKTNEVTKIGDSIRESDSFGDTKWFGAGYRVGLDWSVTPGEYDGGSACKLDGTLETGLDIDVWVLDEKVDLVDGGTVATVEGGTSKVKAEGNLSVFGRQVWSDTKEVVAVFEASKAGKQIVPKDKPEFQVTIGPGITLVGSAWGELMYGAGVEIRGTSEAHDCDLQDIKFGMGMSSSPYFIATGFAQIGASLAGVAGAHIRGGVNLLSLSLPFSAGVDARLKSATGSSLESAYLDFDLGWTMRLGTLSGAIWVVVEVLGIESAHEIFDWSGLSHHIPLITPLETSIPLVTWKD